MRRDGNLRGSGMSHATTASPKPSFRAPWGVGDPVVGRGSAGWTTSKSEHPCPCQNCSQESPAEKTGRRSLLNRPSCRPDDPVGQETELNWTNCAKPLFNMEICLWGFFSSPRPIGSTLTLVHVLWHIIMVSVFFLHPHTPPFRHPPPHFKKTFFSCDGRIKVFHSWNSAAYNCTGNPDSTL